MAIMAVSSPWLLAIELPWVFLYMTWDEHVHAFLLGMYLGADSYVIG